MSLAAQVWVNSLPLDVGVNYAAYRVLGKLADAHHSESNTAYRSADRLAAELGCSKRTIQRALRDLQILGFITKGDQAMVQHLRADRRPTVWDLALDRWAPAPAQPELDGVTTDVAPSEPVDNHHGVTTAVAHGVTTAVALGTGSRTSKERTSATTDRAHARHEWRWTSVGMFCAECGLREDGRKRIDWDAMRVTLVRQSA